MSVADAEALIGRLDRQACDLPPDRAKLGAVDRRLVVADGGQHGVRQHGDVEAPVLVLAVRGRLRQHGVEAAWRVVDPILNSAAPVCEYERGTWGPVEAARIAADAGGWIKPGVEELLTP